MLLMGVPALLPSRQVHAGLRELLSLQGARGPRRECECIRETNDIYHTTMKADAKNKMRYVCFVKMNKRRKKKERIESPRLYY